ncbi:hypothetical protein [Devosia sp.]|uniref:hypothetical protein n=1 Tax=Devosia sp. TaxID=1871048 RepID=UPI003A93BD07
MIAEGAHAGFIAFSYLGVGIMTLGTIGYVLWDARRIKARLAALDKAGIRRRSERRDS